MRPSLRPALLLALFIFAFMGDRGVAAFSPGASSAGMAASSTSTSSSSTPTSTCAAATAASAGVTAEGPRHLAVLVHGYVGTPEDLTYLRETITQFGQGNVLAHTARCNLGRTKDGVQAGGERLAAEVRGLVAANPTLRDISFVGNSLGGLYARYALSLLWDAQTQTVAGLRPVTFLTVATPHLGVRRFLAFPVPDRLHFAAPLFLGHTGNDLFLRPEKADEPPLLLRMVQEEERFLAPLAAFKHRRAYGNVKEDLLVPMGTALFTPPGTSLGAEWLLRERLVVPDPETAHATLEVYHIPSSPSSSSVGSPSVGVVAAAAAATIEPLPSASTTTSSSTGAPVSAAPFTAGSGRLGDAAAAAVTGAVLSQSQSQSQSSSSSSGEGRGEQRERGDWMERLMAAKLDGLRWEKIAVDFRFPLLQAHNKICALSRNKVMGHLFRQGRGVMDHAAQLIVEG